jgi:hypothetical protein
MEDYGYLVKMKLLNGENNGGIFSGFYENFDEVLTNATDHSLETQL